jgi:site-specific recombinase XerC
MGARDRAVLLVGFASGLRRSELAGLDLADVRFERRGVVLYVGRSKTD